MSERMRRVNESVRAVVAEALGDLKDPRLGIVTVTGVSVSPDLHDARVYVSVFGGAKKREGVAWRRSSRRAGVVQGRLARELTHEADAAADLRIRSVGRARRAHDEADRRARTRARLPMTHPDDSRR